jgi:hypothetical protein
VKIEQQALQLRLCHLRSKQLTAGNVTKLLHCSKKVNTVAGRQLSLGYGGLLLPSQSFGLPTHTPGSTCRTCMTVYECRKLVFHCTQAPHLHAQVPEHVGNLLGRQYAVTVRIMLKKQVTQGVARR